MSETNSRTWLIRHSDLSFSRPIPEADLLKFFSEGTMKPQDEICAGNGYWFSLQDVKEMRKHFGNIPMDGLFKKVNEEVTQERYAVTAPIMITPQMKAALKTAPAPVMNTATPLKPTGESIHKASPLMKIMLAALTLLVLVLLFVWFG